MQKYLITGCGRSGTGFYSNLLNENGISCGHESFIDFRGIKNENFIAESSWLAVPFLKQLNPEIQVLRTLRKPVLVIKSFYELSVLNENFSHSPYQQFIYNYLPLISKYNEITRIALYYRDWNALFDKESRSLENTTFIFEEIIPKKSFGFFDNIIKNSMSMVNEKKKSKKREISLDEIDNLLPTTLKEEINNYYNDQCK